MGKLVFIAVEADGRIDIEKEQTENESGMTPTDDGRRLGDSMLDDELAVNEALNPRLH